MVVLDKDTARDLPVFLYDSSDHITPKTGIAEGSVTVKISKNLGALTAFTLIGKWTEIGQGLFKIAFASGDLDTKGFFGYLVTATGCDQYSGMMYVRDFANYKATGFSTHSAADVKTAVEADGSKLDTLYDDWVNGGRLDLLIDAIKAQTDKFLFDASNFVKSIAQNLELAHLDAAISSREVPAHVTAEVDDLITRAKGLNEIYDSVALRALEETLTAIKGAGWTNETLKLIKELIDKLVSGEEPTPRASFRM